MAQAYHPSRVNSPSNQLANFDGLSGEGQLKVEDIQEAYVEQKDRLVNAIDATQGILREIRTFNKNEWIIRYPQYKEAFEAVSPVSASRRKSLRRSLSFADDPATETEVVVRKKLQRSVTVSPISENTEEEETDEDASSDFNVLRLDLKLGPNSTVTSLVSQLEKSSIANLLDERIGASLNHVDKLRLRVEDTSSKVLVTGDLNAGKSTFVNALLRREVMPVDQQPCTTAFCEVHDAAENQGVEEVHVISQSVSYDANDESTFTRAPLSELEGIVGENENTERILKLYLADTRTPSESLLNNGVVDISLIDAPGLNRDSLKTTALFARQEEIDVVVFVVSAENHFTLSAREFLANASKEKAYLFIVVNKFEQIKNKEKCRRLVLEQIKQLSPRTHESADDLVHFVDSAAALQPYAPNPSFDDLESALRSFVLVKRSKSKLHPVSTYLNNLLGDIELLAGANSIVATTELEQAKESLAQIKPVLERMKNGRESLEEGLETLEEEGANGASSRSKVTLAQALERVGQGKLGVNDPSVSFPSYPGILGVWDYARDVRKALLASLDFAVHLAEDEARITTSAGVDRIKDLGEKYLPAGVERNRRVFMPEAMFSTIRKANKGSTKGRRSSAVVAGGIYGLGIGLAQQSELLETTFFDLFDVHHQVWLHLSDGQPDKTNKDDDESSAPTALGLASVGVGALTMVGGQAVGAKGFIEGIIRVTDLFGNETVRKWAAPVLGAVTIGMTAYLILELPNSIPKTVGRRVRTSVLHLHGEDDLSFVDAHALRISRETRKVLRLASWDLKGRFNGAMEERGKEVHVKEEIAKKATRAMEWFGELCRKSEEIRVSARLGIDV
ncbi:transmembrane GTPase fzo1 [Lentinula aciculospora]|uniref:Transmembrane GTPase fzo1 n=1 Tax=Lentinula aciculospora TaxID=153920 RepID=A0A9W9AK65_9AGAR|nr:transmembrane GTPase fzo1 [Lentinula aciculospora]